MRRGETLAAAYLALGFAFISIVALVVEPQLGLVEPSDRFDPDKLSDVARSPILIIGNVVILGFAIALAYLASRAIDIYFRASALIAASGFLVLACLGQAAAAVPSLIENSIHHDIAQVGLAVVRIAFLRVSVFSLGVAAWLSTLGSSAGGLAMLWRALGVLILAGSIAFFFVFLPVPILFTLWAAWYAVRIASAA